LLIPIQTVTVANAAGCTATASATVIANNGSDNIDHYIGNQYDNMGGVVATGNPNQFIWNDLYPPMVTGNVIVPNGKILVIENIQITMPELCKIKVMPGGVLSLQNAKITTCHQWKGIEVLSDTPVSSNAPLSGAFHAYNSMIEKAEIGLASGGNDNGGLANAPGSANLDIKFTTFKNNQIDIGISWNSYNGGHRNIKECLFLTDNDYRFSANPAHIIIMQNHSTVIEYCHFLNENTQTFKGKGCGISSYKSSYYLVGTDISYQNPPGSFLYHRSNATNVPINDPISAGVFEGLEYGVYAFGQSNHYGFRTVIKNQKFKNCEQGLYAAAFASSYNALQISFNEFLNNHSYGAYLDNTEEFQFSDNNFTGGLAGVVVRESSADGAIEINKINRNYFQNCPYSVVAMGCNRGGDGEGQAGLEINCNNFNNATVNGIDVFVYGYDDGGNLHPFGGLKNNQGNPGGRTAADGAGNFFSSKTTRAHILHNAITSINYAHNTDPTSVPHSKPTRVFHDEVGTVSLTDVGVPYDATTCPPAPLLVTTMAEGWQERADALLQKEILSSTLNNLEDGGNTPLLKSEVAFTELQNAYTLYAKLMAKSPYLSEEILAELAAKEDFPKSLLRDVLVANKHAGKTVEVVENLENRSNQLSEYMLDQIKYAAENGISGKEFLEAQIAAQNTRYHAAIAGQIALLDSVGTIADYEAILTNANGMNYQLLLMQQYAAANNLAMANAVLNNIPNNTTLTTQGQANYNDYRTLYTVALKNTQTSPLSFNMADLARLQSIAGNGNAAQAMARGLVEIATHTRTYKEPMPVFPQANQRTKKHTNKNSVKADFVKGSLQVYPNPAKDLVTFQLTAQTEDSRIEIYDAQGRLVYDKILSPDFGSFTVNTLDFNTGVYLYRYSVAGNPLQDGKITIIK
jgi:hypothetical protein